MRAQSIVINKPADTCTGAGRGLLDEVHVEVSAGRSFWPGLIEIKAVNQGGAGGGFSGRVVAVGSGRGVGCVDTKHLEGDSVQEIVPSDREICLRIKIRYN